MRKLLWWGVALIHALATISFSHACTRKVRELAKTENERDAKRRRGKGII